MQQPRPAASFYFDLADPLSYLVAERVMQTLPVAATWQPVLASELGPSDYDAFRCGQDRSAFCESVGARAAALGVQPLRWPQPFPFDSVLAMRVATYAKSIGRVVPFALAAFRQAFAGGRSLAEADNVLIAAAACEMHPTAVLQAASRASVDAELRAASGRAARLGVRTTPTVAFEHEGAWQLFAGEDAPERVARALAGAAA